MTINANGTLADKNQQEWMLQVNRICHVGQNGHQSTSQRWMFPNKNTCFSLMHPCVFPWVSLFLRVLTVVSPSWSDDGGSVGP